MRKAWLAIPVAACAVAALTVAAAAGTGSTAGTVYACVSAQKLIDVTTASPKPCPSGAYPVSWAGNIPAPSPTATSPSPAPTSPSPAPTTPSPGPTTPSPTGTGWACVVSGASGDCPVNGDYTTGSTNSNGYNTYLANNCWADPSCTQTLSANGPGNWQVTSTEPAGNGSVMTGPELQQQFNNWCPAQGTWDNLLANGCPGQDVNVPISALHTFTGTYAETLPGSSQTIAEAAYDIWTNYSSDIMVWQDTVNRCNPGAFGGTTLAAGVKIGNYAYDVYRYGGTGAEVIFVAEGAGGPGTCGNYPSGTVDLLGVLHEAESLGIVSQTAVSLVDLTFEICSTGGVPETFSVSQGSFAAS